MKHKESTVESEKKTPDQMMNEALEEMSSMVEKGVRLQELMLDASKKLKNETMYGHSANNLVKVKLDNDLLPITLRVDPSLLNPDKKSELEEAVCEAIQNGILEGREKVNKMMAGFIKELEPGFDSEEK